MTFEIDAEIDRSHPALPGHFPGNPIVPAVVILAEVSAAIKVAFGSGTEITRLPAVKFLAPLLPGERIRIALQPRGTAALQFTVTRGGQRIALGTAEFSRGAHSDQEHFAA